MTNRYGVVDLFAGPGGLGEGFAGLLRAGRRPFRTVISAEMEASAHATLRLRSFLRAHLRETGELPAEYAAFHRGVAAQPDWSTLHPALWAEAETEAQRLTLGSEEARAPLLQAIAAAGSEDYDDTIVIGGPPCQAYSLVGRARNRGIEGYSAEDDHRHFLFREYIAVLRALHPAVFIMENVKGMLSSAVGGRRVFEMVLEDLQSLGGEQGGLYDLIPLTPRSATRETPQDFVVRAEDHGVPQRRHRVIIVGVRRDIAAEWRARGGGDGVLLPKTPAVTVRDVLKGLPALRSGLSRQTDDPEIWVEARSAMAKFLALLPNEHPELSGPVAATLRALPARMKKGPALSRKIDTALVASGPEAPELTAFLTRAGLSHAAQHETRGHMRSDLARYMFAAAVGEASGTSPKARDFPPELSPEHANWNSGKFNDRFRVQLWDEPSTTVTSHIAKDGHYFIHPDPVQCRSLTVREAARLQTFPDDYLFLGNRTQQFVQVGNAVPPFLARQIAETVLDILEGDGTAR